MKAQSTITAFYQVRRSGRKTKAEVMKQMEDDIIDGVLNNCEDGLEISTFAEKGRGIIATKYVYNVLVMCKLLILMFAIILVYLLYIFGLNLS